MNYWLLKSEPFKYAYHDLERDGATFRDGVRNYQARNYLMEMAEGDLALFYHSNEGKEVMGIAKISSTAYPDPKDESGKWVVIDIKPHEKFTYPVALGTLRADEQLKKMNIFRQIRLSVVSVSQEDFDRICAMGRTGNISAE